MKWSQRIGRRSLGAIGVGSTLVAMIVFLRVAAVEATNADAVAGSHLSGTVTWADGKLSAKVPSASAGEVLEEVARLTGAQLNWLGEGADVRVSLEFESLPLASGLKRILGDRHFVLVYAPDEKNGPPPRLWIMSARGGSSSAGDISPSRGQSSVDAIADPDALSEGGVLDKDTLSDVALSHRDPVVRLDAVTQLGADVESDEQIRALLSQIAESDENEQVQETAKELLRNVGQTER